MNAQVDTSSRRKPVLTRSSTDPVHRALCESLYSATISSLSRLGPAYVSRCKEVTCGNVRANLLALKTGLILTAESGVVRNVDNWLERFACQYATEIGKENESREYPFLYSRTLNVEDPDITIEISSEHGVKLDICLCYSETEHQCQDSCLPSKGGPCTIKAEQSQHGLATFCPSVFDNQAEGNVWDVQSNADDDAFWFTV